MSNKELVESNMQDEEFKEILEALPTEEDLNLHIDIDENEEENN